MIAQFSCLVFSRGAVRASWERRDIARDRVIRMPRFQSPRDERRFFVGPFGVGALVALRCFVVERDARRDGFLEGTARGDGFCTSDEAARRDAFFRTALFALRCTPESEPSSRLSKACATMPRHSSVYPGESTFGNLATLVQNSLALRLWLSARDSGISTRKSISSPRIVNIHSNGPKSGTFERIRLSGCSGLNSPRAALSKISAFS